VVLLLDISSDLVPMPCGTSSTSVVQKLND